MVNNCVAYGCKNYVGKKEGLRFFRFPLSDKERCGKWTAAVRREKWQPTKSSRLCNEHFVTGSPHHHPSHPDYVPSVFSFIGGNVSGKVRCDRLVERKKRQEQQQLEKIKRQERLEREKEIQEATRREEEERNQREMERIQKEKKKEEEQSQREAVQQQLGAAHALVEFSQQEFVRDASIQTEDNLVSQIELLKAQNLKLKSKVFSVKMVEGNNIATQFYTGLSNYGVFLHVFSFLAPHITPSKCLPLEEEFFLMLVKLRLNLKLQDLGTRFSISKSATYTIFQKWLEVMFVRLKFLITWPAREVVRNNLPPLFKELYPNCVVIIDCSEVFIETPSKFEARSKTYSNYKKHNTVKFLIGITPCGSISFLSQCWGGRVSDKNLTQECGFLKMLQYGDVVLADRGFTIEEDVALTGAKLEIPAFTRGKRQLSQQEVERSKQLSAVRIHVERIIGVLKNRYVIMKGPFPTKLLKHDGDQIYSNIDKILVVCSALTNLGQRVVS